MAKKKVQYLGAVEGETREQQLEREAENRRRLLKALDPDMHGWVTEMFAQLGLHQ